MATQKCVPASVASRMSAAQKRSAVSRKRTAESKKRTGKRPSYAKHLRKCALF